MPQPDPAATFAGMRDTDPLMFEAEQSRLMLSAALKHCRDAMKVCDHQIVRAELDAAEAAIDLAHGCMGNALGCQAKRIQEEDPDEW